MQTFCDEIILSSLRRKALGALSDLSHPILHPAEQLCEANSGFPVGDELRRHKASLGVLSAVCKRVGERSPPRLHVSAAPPAASAGEEKGARCIYVESTSTPTKNPLG